jgi:flagellar biosynthesis protein FliR
MNENLMLLYALIFLRMVSFIFSMAIIGTAQFSSQIKILVAVVLTALITPTLAPDLTSLSQSLSFTDEKLWILSVYQVLIGVSLGFVSRFFFFSLSIGAEWIGISSGSSSAQIFNPASGVQSSVFDQFYVILISLLFFTLNAHHVLLLSLVESFRKLPPMMLSQNTFDMNFLILHFKETIVYGVKIALPIILPILIVNVVMGVLSRVVPQMNVFVTSLQVTFILTIIIMIISLPLLFDEFRHLISLTLNRVHQVTGSL